jgi:RNA polymerase sigma-70 factor (ECF subfamily)
VPDPTNQIRAWCQTGDAAAFRQFYREQAPKLWKFLIARGCDRETAYDLLADAFLRFTQTVCRDPRAPVALLYRIAINLRIDAYRRETVAATDAVENLDELPVAAPVEPDDHAQVRALVKTLPESEQNLLLLRYWIGLSHKEVAHALGLPEGTVRRQCAEALDKIRERWEGSEGKHAAG